MVPPFLNTSGPGHIPHQQVCYGVLYIELLRYVIIVVQVVANIAPVSIINSTEETEGVST